MLRNWIIDLGTQDLFCTLRKKYRDFLNLCTNSTTIRSAIQRKQICETYVNEERQFLVLSFEDVIWVYAFASIVILIHVYEYTHFYRVLFAGLCVSVGLSDKCSCGMALIQQFHFHSSSVLVPFVGIEPHERALDCLPAWLLVIHIISLTEYCSISIALGLGGSTGYHEV